MPTLGMDLRAKDVPMDEVFEALRSTPDASWMYNWY
jgi:hypothetical protein